MTPAEILTQRWDLVQQARLKEMQLITSRVHRDRRLAMVEALNTEPFWESLFDQMEKELRQLDPDHEYLPENHIQID